MPRTHIPEDVRFWSRVDVWADCWMWTGARANGGYGLWNSKRGNKAIRAHRWAYESLVGPIPDGLTLDHLCRNRVCVNPDHLEPVPNRVNVLRGNGHTARNARKTHCIHGHNNWVAAAEAPKRICGTCRQIRNAARPRPHA